MRNIFKLVIVIFIVLLIVMASYHLISLYFNELNQDKADIPVNQVTTTNDVKEDNNLPIQVTMEVIVKKTDLPLCPDCKKYKNQINDLNKKVSKLRNDNINLAVSNLQLKKESDLLIGKLLKSLDDVEDYKFLYKLYGTICYINGLGWMDVEGKVEKK